MVGVEHFLLDPLPSPGGVMSTGLLLPVPASPPDQPQTLAIRPWPDGVIDALGHDPRSNYVEQTGTRVRFERVVLSG